MGHLALGALAAVIRFLLLAILLGFAAPGVGATEEPPRVEKAAFTSAVGPDDKPVDTLAETTLDQGRIFFYVLLDGLRPHGQYTVTSRVRDGDGRLVCELPFDFQPTGERWFLSYPIDLNRYLDAPGDWTFELHHGSQRLFARQLKVSPGTTLFGVTPFWAAAIPAVIWLALELAGYLAVPRIKAPDRRLRAFWAIEVAATIAFLALLGFLLGREDFWRFGVPLGLALLALTLWGTRFCASCGYRDYFRRKSAPFCQRCGHRFLRDRVMST